MCWGCSFTEWWGRIRTRRRTQPIGNIVSQSDSVTATAATTATAAACISSLKGTAYVEAPDIT